MRVDAAFLGLLLASLAACGGNAGKLGGDAGLLGDAGSQGGTMLADSGSFFNDAGVECCYPSAQPSCCMRYGGAASLETTCYTVCDGMPQASGFHLAIDRFGCPTWSSKGSTAPCCGGPPPEDGGTPMENQCVPDLDPVD